LELGLFFVLFGCVIALELHTVLIVVCNVSADLVSLVSSVLNILLDGCFGLLGILALLLTLRITVLSHHGQVSLLCPNVLLDRLSYEFLRLKLVFVPFNLLLHFELFLFV